ncbi:hypothetical protein KEJ33_00340 [Candidatus Bathyarchaeota archaeon]|nr:hypothetical protein [Candidatus Bathyarchaeota archaeon]
MGRVSKGVKCSVQACGKDAIRSLPIDEVTSAGLEVQGINRVYLCKDHYKQFKKATKKVKMVEKWRYGGRIT